MHDYTRREFKFINNGSASSLVLLSDAIFRGVASGVVCCVDLTLLLTLFSDQLLDDGIEMTSSVVHFGH